ncbi:MAG: Rpn family recombination-promoting nuclease/putative transposase [Planctomycetaceae bacterium]|jgi:predicted transposase YdaD|nr:Rpn family recombination-promoting nuclease/putative transposase [Planctomycetaceae bacterium]
MSKENLINKINQSNEFISSLSMEDLLRLFPKTYNHDEYCKNIFAILEIARRIFLCIFPSEMTKTIDLNRLEIVDTKFISNQLRINLFDMLYRVPLNEIESWVYFLIEFKSNNDQGTIIQLYQYVNTIWMKLWNDNGKPDDFFFPCVVSMIFHCGESPFTGIINIADQVDLPANSYFRSSTINYKSLLYDLNTKSKSDLPEEPIVNMFFTVHLIAREKDADEQAFTLFTKFQYNIRNDKLLAVVWDISLWYLCTSAKHFTTGMYEKLIKLTQEIGGKIMTPSVIETYYDQATKQGITIGETRGIAIGETRGEIRGESSGRAALSRIVTRDLRRRFGELSAELQNRITETQSLGKLEELSEFALTCVSLGEFETALD